MLDTTETNTAQNGAAGPTLVENAVVEIEAGVLQILLAAVDAGSQKGVFLANQLSTVGRAFDAGVAILQGAVK